MSNLSVARTLLIISELLFQEGTTLPGEASFCLRYGIAVTFVDFVVQQLTNNFRLGFASFV